MKKVMGILAIVLLAIVAQSCGSGEKCPAYSQSPTVSDSVNC